MDKKHRNGPHLHAANKLVCDTDVQGRETNGKDKCVQLQSQSTAPQTHQVRSTILIFELNHERKKWPIYPP